MGAMATFLIAVQNRQGSRMANPDTKENQVLVMDLVHPAHLRFSYFLSAFALEPLHIPLNTYENLSFISAVPYPGVGHGPKWRIQNLQQRFDL